MINPKFHLQAPQGATEGEFPVLMLFSVNGKRLQYYTGIRVPIKYRLKGGKYPFAHKLPDATRVKIKLDALLRHAYSIESDFIQNGTNQTVENFKNELDIRFKGRAIAKAKIKSVNDVIKNFLDHYKENYSYNTHRATKTVLNLFSEYLATKPGIKELSDITDETIEDFKVYIKTDRLNNTVVKCMQILRTFFQYCLNKKLILKAPQIDTGRPNDITVIHLTSDEVMKIAYTPMPSVTLERVRDFFLFGCFTGMRYGDIAALKKNNIHKDDIKFFNEKNGSTQTITVPFTTISRSILRKYSNIPGEYALPSISNQKTNDYIKEVGRIAGLDNKIVIAEKNAQGKINTSEHELWELLSCHVSRKSFITIAMTLEIPESTIISITGHSKGSKAFHKYYEVMDESKFEAMAKFG